MSMPDDTEHLVCILLARFEGSLLDQVSVWSYSSHEVSLLWHGQEISLFHNMRMVPPPSSATEAGDEFMRAKCTERSKSPVC